MTTKTFSPTILAVGDIADDSSENLPGPDAGNVTFVEFLDVTEDLLRHVAPAVILSPLMCLSFDCLDLAVRLKSLGFDGKYRVLAPDAANPRMIKTEVAAQARGLDFDIVTSLENAL